MIDLKALPHTETLVPITITRLGEERTTRYQISQSEAKPADEERITAPILTGQDIKNNFARWKNANVT
jgi:hypothetical protein